LAELGHAQNKIEERITVRPPTPQEATFLPMTEDLRVYEIVHFGWTIDDRPAKVTLYVMPTGWNGGLICSSSSSSRTTVTRGSSPSSTWPPGKQPCLREQVVNQHDRPIGLIEEGRIYDEMLGRCRRLLQPEKLSPRVDPVQHPPLVRSLPLIMRRYARDEITDYRARPIVG
jgi:hypothetical protein